MSIIINDDIEFGNTRYGHDFAASRADLIGYLRAYLLEEPAESHEVGTLPKSHLMVETKTSRGEK